MTELAVLNPEIEGLLREIAADPTSTLLRLPPSGLRRSRRLGELPDRAGTTGLNLAERELLRRWREEVAYLLLVACFRRITRSVDLGIRIRSFRNEAAIRPGEFRARTRAAVRGCTEEQAGNALPRGLLEDHRQRGEQHLAIALECAESSSRFRASDLATCYAALCLIVGESPEAGVRLMAKANSESGSVRRMKAMNTVYGYERMGRIDDALEAAEFRNWPPESLTARAVFACLLAARTRDTGKLSKWMDRLVELQPNAADIAIAVADAKRRRLAGDWNSTPETAELLKRATRNRNWEIEQVVNAVS